MKRHLIFGKTLAFLTILVAAQVALAQKPVESTHVDEKYANTTVVYKNTAASDKEVLQSIENDFGIGDVIRVTIAPPPQKKIDADPASAPVHADPAKGEDTWMPKESVAARQNLSSSADPVTGVQLAVNQATHKQAAPVYAAAPTVKKEVAAPTMTAKKPVALPAQKAAENAPAPVAGPATPTNAPATTLAVAPARAKAAAGGGSAHKSVKKAVKKSSHKVKLKNRKPGKQRYACPKF